MCVCVCVTPPPAFNMSGGVLSVNDILVRQVTSQLRSAEGCACYDQHGFAVAVSGNVPPGAVSAVNIGKYSAALYGHKTKPPIVVLETTHKTVIIQCCDNVILAVFQPPTKRHLMQELL